ncbi:KH domain-containing RNA-binding protein qki.L-like isoform X4 [Mya arenaria]|uniref:KH domain-containing RNA-binding protein qki.L-like isoform X4 n=1 Tax=Mya arenaria TaxID=6604 RepID=UPI0022E0F9ED|nr:KH domain-containing RNA-binding protein qki.L-like isoform X4 [Mya arenaria]XP_052810093.1 KH domain-containing RNA-binding protein qki.L-like isoform X4 [Mya arenaria]
MGTDTNKDERNNPEYLAQLLKDKKQIQAFPNVFVHLEKLLDEEINRVRLCLFHNKSTAREPLNLPDTQGPVVTLQEKLFVPVKEHPDFNFVGRILGPRGMTAKELEQYTGCKVMVRGKGSMRDKAKEEQNRGKPNWEHLNEELHVLITVEDTRNRAELKIIKAVEEVKKLLVPSPDGEDDLKKRQLMELAIINGTYRDTSKPTSTQTTTASATQAARFITSPMAGMTAMQQLRSPTPAGAPLILAPRMPIGIQTTQAASNAALSNMLMNGGPPPLVSPSEAGNQGLMYNPYEYPFNFTPGTAIMEYPTLDQSAAGAVPKMRRTLAGVREHPYGFWR